MANKSIIGATCACLAVVSFSADAALVGRLAVTPGGTDYQAYYDTEAKLTWLADANYAETSGYDADGQMIWADANVWAAGLDVAGVTGWRLADTIQPDTSCSGEINGAYFGTNCTGSELGNLFYNVLGGTAGSSITTSHNANFNLFSNVSRYDPYWSATEYSTTQAFGFYMGNGTQSIYAKTPGSISNFHESWAVHSGDVVPVPAAVWLFTSGLIGLVGFARRKART